MSSDDTPQDRPQDHVESGQDESAGDFLWGRLKPLLKIANGLAGLLLLLAKAGLVGAVLGTIGLILMGFTGGWAVFAILLGAIALIPPFLAWQGAQAFADLRDLPAKLRDLGELPERAVDEAKDLASNAARGNAMDLLRQARPVVRDLIGLVPVVATARSFNPAMLMAIAGAALSSAVVAGFGLLLFLFGLVVAF